VSTPSIQQRLRRVITLDDVDDVMRSETPWSANAEFTYWHVSVPSLDGLAREFVDCVIALSSSMDWGSGACCVRLHNGLFAAWRGWEDVTGSSFHGDAYGGDAVVYLADQADALLDTLRREQGIEGSPEFSSLVPQLEDVLLDLWIREEYDRARDLARREDYLGSVDHRLNWARHISLPFEVD
jgi:hypothetical protein